MGGGRGSCWCRRSGGGGFEPLLGYRAPEIWTFNTEFSKMHLIGNADKSAAAFLALVPSFPR